MSTDQFYFFADFRYFIFDGYKNSNAYVFEYVFLNVSFFSCSSQIPESARLVVSLSRSRQMRHWVDSARKDLFARIDTTYVLVWATLVKQQIKNGATRERKLFHELLQLHFHGFGRWECVFLHDILAICKGDWLNFHQRFWLCFADPRTNNWPLIASPIPGLTILAAYLYFVISWGPRYMANRKPYKLENILLVYNFLQVAISVYLFYEVSFTPTKKKSLLEKKKKKKS